MPHSPLIKMQLHFNISSSHLHRLECLLLLLLHLLLQVFFGMNSSASSVKLLPSSLSLYSPSISQFWISCSGRSTMYPFLVRILYPLVTPSFLTILSLTLPSLHLPLTFTESLISITLPSPSWVISGLATCFLSLMNCSLVFLYPAFVQLFSASWNEP